MTFITLTTTIRAPLQICFDLSRSIDLHQHSTRHTREEAIAGRTAGLIEKDEFVTWRATHFFIRQTMSVKITEMHPPIYFRDEMITGPFACMHHEHVFAQTFDETKMIDKFYYEVPYGFAGKWFDALFLKKHMEHLLLLRNKMIKAVAENGEWKNYVNKG